MLTDLSNSDLNVSLLCCPAVSRHDNATSNDVTPSVMAAFTSQDQHSYVRIEVQKKKKKIEILLILQTEALREDCTNAQVDLILR